MNEGGDETGYFRTLYSNSPDGVYLLDDDDPISDVIPGACKSHGWEPGFPDNDPSTLLETGSITRDDGSGLGWYILRQIVDAHGWTIELADHYGEGARIEVHDVDPGRED